MAKVVEVTASPSLALIKYWGKQDREQNLPATTSLAVSLDGLYTTTAVSLADGDCDRVLLNGSEADPARYRALFERMRAVWRVEHRWSVTSENNFPTAAGLASSSSGLAALTAGCAALSADPTDLQQLSALARLGSASAARAVYSGFTVLPAGAETAQPLLPAEHWPDFRVVVVPLVKEQKPVSSREAMELARTTSPYYRQWLADAAVTAEQAESALRVREWDRLGPLIRRSYLNMFATMFSSAPPVNYWYPDSVRLQQLCARLRSDGVHAWETMDAGPQIKICCPAGAVEQICSSVVQVLEGRISRRELLVCAPGGGLSVRTLSD